MKTGEKYLISCDNWFFAPDGENYRAVFGTVHGVQDAESVLGVKTNARSTNWYVLIGDMVLAGCQIHYAIRTDAVSFDAPLAEVDHDGARHKVDCALTRIYDADKSGLVAGL